MINKNRIFPVLLAILLIFIVSFSYPKTATAIIQQQIEAPEQLLYSSRHKLQDNLGNTWQVILFKRIKNNQIQTMNLRLIGFPEKFTFIHPQNLTIKIDEQESLFAVDQFAEQSPSPNVGEFKVQDILPHLSLNQTVKLTLPLTSISPVEILLPAPVVLEWQEIVES